MKQITAASIHASVDFVIAADGRTVGPDAAKTLKSLRDEVNAYTTMRQEMLNRLQSSATDDSIKGWLANLSAQPLYRDPATAQTDRFVAVQKGLANAWTFQLSANRSDLLAKLLAMTPEASYSIAMSLKGGLK